MREGREEDREEMLEQQLECYEFSLIKKQSISNQRTKERAIEEF